MVQSKAILLLSMDVEENPGPENWTALRAPNYCNYLRVAIYKVFTGVKLIPSEDTEDQIVSVEDGFDEL